jgi:hypothetical protein
MSERRITDQELNVLSAWWHFHGVAAAARFFGRSEQTIKNQLMDARRRNGFHTTAELAQAFMSQLRTVDELMTHHNVFGRAA